MDSARFDHLARALGEYVPRRRALGLLSSLAAGLGLELMPGPDDARGKKKKKKHKGQFRCDANGEWVDTCVGGQILVLTDVDCYCRCPEGQNYKEECKRCYTPGAPFCCPGEKWCGGTCIPEKECCPSTQRECTRKVKQGGKTKTVKTCVPLGTCCRGEERCSIAEDGCCNTLAGEECAAFEGCCNTLLDKYVCDGTYCCEANEDCCANEGCVPRNQACCITPCSSDPKGCCGVGEQCCPLSGCRPDSEQCCGVGEVYTSFDGCCNTSTHTVCGGIKCCEAGRTCTTGSSFGGPRAGCCYPGEFPCDGVCCVEGHCGCCEPGQSNPCLCC